MLMGESYHADAKKEHSGAGDKTPKEALHPTPQVHKIGDDDIDAQPGFEFIGRDRFEQRSARIEFTDLAGNEKKQNKNRSPRKGELPAEKGEKKGKKDGCRKRDEKGIPSRCIQASAR